MRLRILAALALASLTAERFVRAVLPSVSVVLFFVALGWSGVWLGAPVALRIAGAAFFILALLWSLRAWRGFSLPSRAEALAALDRGHSAAPATSFADALANQSAPQTDALWRLHLRRISALVGVLPPAPARLRPFAQDPYALTALACLALGAAAFVAGPEKYARGAAAFDWRGLRHDAPPARVDAWIDPPAYTGRAPIVLALESDKEPVAAPVGSIVVVRGGAGAKLEVTVKGGLTPRSEKEPNPLEFRFLLNGDGAMSVARDGGALARLDLRALPDLPPTITPLGGPKANARATLTLAYRLDDDYAAREARVTATAPRNMSEPIGNALAPPPSGALELGSGPGGLGEARTSLDWSDSPYAGATVDLQYEVRDDAGNVGRALVENVVLPEKPLNNPLARALAEQRRILMLDSRSRVAVRSALEGLMIAPELFSRKSGVYLGLRYATTTLRHARKDEELTEIADLLWAMALQIEEGDLPAAERELRAAQKALREALERGASQEEIERLTEQFKKALDAYLAQLQKNAQQQANKPGQRESTQTISPDELKNMLDKMAEASRNGDKDAARDMLDRLQEMLENMKAASGDNGADQARRDREMMRDLDKMMREQQKLRDDTFARERGAPPKEGESPKAESLESRQQQLRQKLEDMQKQSSGGEKKSMQDAGQAMSKSENDLKSGDDSGALTAQEKAMGALRKSASELASKMSRDAKGESGAERNSPDARGKNGQNPFAQSSQPDLRDNSAQRTRQILDELRRRLSDPGRPPGEIDYLERLIRPN